ncbi:hypothetical protein [Cupriavidus sp. CuC1]
MRCELVGHAIAVNDAAAPTELTPREHIYEKLGVETRTAAVAAAQRALA